MTEQRHYESTRSASDRTGIGIRTLQRKVAVGALTAYKVPGSRLVRLDVAEVDALLVPTVAGAAA